MTLSRFAMVGALLRSLHFLLLVTLPTPFLILSLCPIRLRSRIPLLTASAHSMTSRSLNWPEMRLSLRWLRLKPLRAGRTA